MALSFVAVSLLNAAQAWADNPDLAVAACDAVEIVEVRESAEFSDPSERGSARQSAIRRGVVDALRQAGGADVSFSTRTATTSSSTSIKRRRREHVVIRGGGRVTDWEVISERAKREADGERLLLDVTVRVEVCPSPDRPAPIVVAIADTNPSAGGISQETRSRIAEHYTNYAHVDIVRETPSDTFYDVRIQFDHKVEIKKVDNSRKAKILERFRDLDLLDDRTLQFKLVTVTSTAKAVRFVDETTISHTVKRRQRVPLDASVTDAVEDLLVETSVMAARPLGERLGAGELDYSSR